jgi:hypothetical protein
MADEPEPTSESETAAILADPDAMEAIAEAEAEEPQPQFNPLRTWDQLVDELGDPTNPSLYGSIPEEDLDR